MSGLVAADDVHEVWCALAGSADGPSPDIQERLRSTDNAVQIHLLHELVPPWTAVLPLPAQGLDRRSTLVRSERRIEGEADVDPRAKQYADIAGKLIHGADNAKAAGDMTAHVEILTVALQYVLLAKQFQRMADASAALDAAKN